MLSLIQSSNIVHSYGCDIVALTKGKFTGSAKYKIIYNDKQLWFKELLGKDSSVSIHERSVQILATQMYKAITFHLPIWTNCLK